MEPCLFSVVHGHIQNFYRDSTAFTEDEVSSILLTLIDGEKILQPESLVQSALQKLCNKIQMLVDSLKKTTCSEMNQTNPQPAEEELSSTRADSPDIIEIDPALVQIKADSLEINRRIQAFLEKKQAERNENNIREFCNIIKEEPGESRCARTDAVYVCRVDGKSHVRVTKVHNQYGPQTLPFCKREAPGVGGGSYGAVPHTHPAALSGEHKPGLPQGVQERLCNMEEHLNITQGKPVPRNVYERLQKLEDRILHLEGLSPEYFNPNDHPPDVKKRRSDVNPGLQNHGAPNQSYQQYEEQDMKIGDIDQRIQRLKQMLLHRQNGQSKPVIKTEPVQ